MFSWNISRTAEAMFSRWAMKRLCQFLLKKKLGKFVLGDIDLNQLDVQLGAGLVQLSDVALNVDYINAKLGTAAVLVKEGTIGLLKVAMPWEEGGCRIELDEVEVVLAPQIAKVRHDEVETPPYSKNDEGINSHVVQKPDDGASGSRMANASVEVHEGVKTIARLVKWILTSFQVKIKGLIMAFDPSLEGGSEKGLDRILVLRISEAECGTQIFDDASSGSFSIMHSFLGLSRLTNFLRFRGAVLELLLCDGLNHLSSIDSSNGTYNEKSLPGCFSFGNVITVISGGKKGFSGSLKLSLPWKNGTLDTSKVDADLQIEPLELRIEPSTIRFFIFMWNQFKCMGDRSKDQDYSVPSHYVATSSSNMHCSEQDLTGKKGVANSYSMPKEPLNFLLSESHLIYDWVSRKQEERTEEEPDFVASVDQFFECFDGLRNSQSALGNSVMWNWTCSVFSAITAASNLASGSVQLSSELQHGETKFNAVIEKVSLLLFFSDEDLGQCPKVMDDKSTAAFHSHSLRAHFIGLGLSFQVLYQEMSLEANVQHIQLDDHLYLKKNLVDYMHHDLNENLGTDMHHDHNENLGTVNASMQKVQDGVQGAICTFKVSDKDHGMCHRVDSDDMFSCFHHSSEFSQMNDDVSDSVTLLRTFGISHCYLRSNSSISITPVNGRTSFSLNLAPFVFWVNFDVIGFVQDFLKDITSSFETSIETGCLVESEAQIDGFSTLGDQQKSSSLKSSSLPTSNTLEGNVFLTCARIILCFPLRSQRVLCSYFSIDHFVVFDIVGGDTVKQVSVASAEKRHPVTTQSFVDVNFGDLHLFLVRPVFDEISGSETCKRQATSFSSEKIACVVNGTGHLSVISVFWQDRPSTGPWIAKKAKFLVSGDNERTEDNFVGKSSEFASATIAKDNREFEYQTRQEILLSSGLLLHVHLSAVIIDLSRRQYESFLSLLDQIIQHFSHSNSESVQTRAQDYLFQTSILVEFESMTLSLTIEPVKDTKCSVSAELPGSWLSLSLQVYKFELLSVCSIGGIEDSNFLHIAHHQGSLWGATTEGQKFLLISCSDSTRGRGDGGGSNVLLPKNAGSVIMNYWDPEHNHNFTSVTVECATLIAVGGRLDWFLSILTFFAPNSTNSGKADGSSMNRSSGSSFTLNMVDVGLSYEPCSGNDSKAEPYVGCMLAASLLKLSNASTPNCKEKEYKIRMQDVGFLIARTSECNLFGRVHSAGHLRKIGYVKVAEEALIEAVLKLNCENGRAWEIECAESHVILNTCHDSTVGLIRLSGQLQKLFAPDMADYVVHLENRWNDVQLLHETDGISSNCVFPQKPSQLETSSIDEKSKPSNLMDLVCDDTFQLDRTSESRGRSVESCTNASSRHSSLLPSGASSSEEEKNAGFLEEYFLVDLNPLSGLSTKSKTPGNSNVSLGEDRTGNAKWYYDTSLKILENHAAEVEPATVHKPVECEASTSGSDYFDVDKAEGCILLKDIKIVWRMHGGSDWPNFQNASPASVRNCSRDSTVCLELVLSGIEVDYHFYPEGGICSSRLSLTIHDVCIIDRSVNAPWKLVLGYHRSRKHPRKFPSSALKLNLEAVRPNPVIRLEENRLQIALLPMRLHLHQSQLDFLIGFFEESSSPAEAFQDTMAFSKSVEPFHESTDLQSASIREEALLPYFQKFDIRPLTVRVDYRPCRVDFTALRGGKYVELVNLVPWKGVDLQLKRVQGVGQYGWGCVLETILGEWLEDISQNQIQKLLKGLPPIKSIVSVGSGAAKLVSQPLKSYKKDHRLLRGLQRGTFAFLKSISLEALDVGVHLASGAHNILNQAEYLLASIPPSVPWPVESGVAISNVKANQPSDAQQGIQQACQSISDGLGKSASALVKTPLKRYQRGDGVGSALVTAVQSAPAAAVAPASAAAHAVHCALLGLRNSLDPDHMRESVEKYSGNSQPHESIE